MVHDLGVVVPRKSNCHVARLDLGIVLDGSNGWIVLLVAGLTVSHPHNFKLLDIWVLLDDAFEFPEHAVEICASGGVEAVDLPLVLLVVVRRESVVDLVAERDGDELLKRSLVALEISFSKLQASLLQRWNTATHRARDIEALDKNLVLTRLVVHVAFALSYLLIALFAHLGRKLDVRLGVGDWEVLAGHNIDVFACFRLLLLGLLGLFDWAVHDYLLHLLLLLYLLLLLFLLGAGAQAGSGLLLLLLLLVLVSVLSHCKRKFAYLKY